jgi:hypothetical protein
LFTLDADGNFPAQSLNVRRLAAAREPLMTPRVLLYVSIAGYRLSGPAAIARGLPRAD